MYINDFKVIDGKITENIVYVDYLGKPNQVLYPIIYYLELKTIEGCYNFVGYNIVKKDFEDIKNDFRVVTIEEHNFVAKYNNSKFMFNSFYTGSLEEETKKILSKYLELKGHDKCWYYPDLFNELMRLYGFKVEDPELPPIEEFKEGCKKYQEEIYNMSSKDSNPKDAIGIKKIAFSCVPFNVIAEIALGLMEGARKYRRHNYRAIGVRGSVYYDAALRHLSQWWEGEDIDPDSGLNHISKALSCLTVLRDAMLNDNWNDDRPPRVKNQEWVREANQKAKEIIEKYPVNLPAYTQVDLDKSTEPGRNNEY